MGRRRLEWEQSRVEREARPGSRMAIRRGAPVASQQSRILRADDAKISSDP